MTDKLEGVIVKSGTKYSCPLIKKFKTNEQFEIQHNGFFPVDVGDIFIGSGKIDGNVFVVTSNYVVRIGEDSQTIVNFIHRSLMIKGTYFTVRHAKTYWEHIGKDNNDIEKTIKQINNRSISYVMNNNLTNPPEDDDLEGGLSLTQITVFLKKWYDRRLIRQLHLLGLYNRDIKSCHMDPVEIFKVAQINPFKLVGISIEKADELIDYFGINLPNDDRQAGIALRVLAENSNKKAWAATPIITLKKSVSGLTNEQILLLVREYPVISEKNFIYLQYNYRVETYVSEYIVSKLSQKDNTFDVTYNSGMSGEQKDATLMSLNKPICMIMGKAGCGKTTVIKEIITLMKASDNMYFLLSFTGKAVSRIKEVVPDENPMTIHRFIGNDVELEKGALFIIDEVSMVTTELFYKLLRKIGNVNVRFTFIGDNNQLPPITWGAFLDEIIKIKEIPRVFLTKNFRIKEGENNTLYKNLELILNPPRLVENNLTAYKKLKLFSGDNFKLYTGTQDRAVEEFMKFVNGGADIKDIMLISPYRAPLSTLNYIIECEIFKDDEEFDDYLKRHWCKGNRILINRNCYDVSPPLYNGQDGFILDVNEREMEIEVFGNNYTIPLYAPIAINDKDHQDESSGNTNDIKCLDKGMCITIHKSQGSEKQYVLIILPKACHTFVDRRMIYTAVSRAIGTVVIIEEEPNTLVQCVYKDPTVRYDSLAVKIVDLIKKKTENERLSMLEDAITMVEEFETEDRLDVAENKVVTYIAQKIDIFSISSNGLTEDDVKFE